MSAGVGPLQNLPLEKNQYLLSSTSGPSWHPANDPFFSRWKVLGHFYHEQLDKNISGKLFIKRLFTP